MLGYARYVTMRYIHVWRYIKYYVKHCCQLYNSVLKKYSWSKYFLLFQTMSFSSRILAPKILNIAARLWWDSNLPIFTKMWIYFIVFLTTSKKNARQVISLIFMIRTYIVCSFSVFVIWLDNLHPPYKHDNEIWESLTKTFCVYRLLDFVTTWVFQHNSFIVD